MFPFCLSFPDFSVCQTTGCVVLLTPLQLDAKQVIFSHYVMQFCFLTAQIRVNVPVKLSLFSMCMTRKCPFPYLSKEHSLVYQMDSLNVPSRQTMLNNTGHHDTHPFPFPRFDFVDKQQQGSSVSIITKNCKLTITLSSRRLEEAYIPPVYDDMEACINEEDLL